MSDPQDMAELFDEEMVGDDPAPDDPYLLDEELNVEPIDDSFAVRASRLEPDFTGDEPPEEITALAVEGTSVVGDLADESAEEAAIHLVRERSRARHRPS